MEANDFSYWYSTINQWIVNMVKEHPKEWKYDEQLQEFEIDLAQTCSISRSIAYRSVDSIKFSSMDKNSIDERG